MDKAKISGKHQTYLENLANLDLDKVKGLHKANPIMDLIDSKKTAMAVFECLVNNDPEGAMEIIEIYLEALDKTKMRSKTKLPKSTLYSALKHRNPTIKTLAKIMHASAH